jgi:hypothetical protein
MNAEQTIRLMAHEAVRCREVLSRPGLTLQDARDALEMYALLHPPALKVLDLPMPDAGEAAALLHEFHDAIRDRQRVMTGQDFQ